MSVWLPLPKEKTKLVQPRSHPTDGMDKLRGECKRKRGGKIRLL